jgi:hemolysin activation/secretion protein
MADDRKAARILVKRIEIDGATLVPPEELTTLVADLVGQTLSLAELEHGAQRIAEYYRERGWYVRVYLPQQDVSAGTVRIQVLEGRYGRSHRQEKGSRADGAYVEHLATHRLIPGQALSAADLERGLLLANDLAGIRATGLLTAGDALGSSDLSLQIEDTAFLTGDVGFNDHGVKSTGTAQWVGGFALNNLSGVGDRLGLRALVGQDIRNAQLQYSRPIGMDGWRWGAHLSSLDYQLGGRYRSLSAEGAAHTAGFDLTWAWVRQSDRNLNLNLAYEHRRYNDDMLGQALRRHRVNALDLGLSGDLRDGWNGGGITWGSADLTLGKLDIDAIPTDQAADGAGPRSAGGYSKLAFQVSRLQALSTSNWQLLGSLSGQLADGNLGSSERFTLGGPSRVRAYPVNEASGDEGGLMKLELQRELGHGWQGIVFLDAGHIRQHKHSWAGWQGGSNQPNTYGLAGVGIGANWRAEGWLLAASAAIPVGHHPGQDALGRNNDGSQANEARYWLSLSRLF